MIGGGKGVQGVLSMIFDMLSYFLDIPTVPSPVLIHKLQYDLLRSVLLSRIVYSPTLECIAFKFCRPQNIPKRHVVIPQ